MKKMALTMTVLCSATTMAGLAAAEPTRLGPSAMDMVTAGSQTGDPFGTAVVVRAVQGIDQPGQRISGIARDLGGLGDTQTGQISGPDIIGEANKP